MATVGLNFGSAGGGTGFDVTATVTSILAIEQGIETPWKTQLTSLKAQDAALSTFGTDLSTLATSLQALTDFTGVFAAKQGSSSDTSVISLSSASSAAVAGSHSIVVTSLATTSSDYSNRVANASVTLAGSLNIKIGSGASQTIAAGSGSDTLASFAAAINAASLGVTANVVTDTLGSRLSLVSSTSGAAGQITLSSSLTDSTTGTALSFSTGQTGADAALKVDGLDTTSASNTVTGAIPGVTFQLLSASASASSPVQVQITNDNAAIGTAFDSFVAAYNAVVTDIKTQEGKDSSGNAEPLYGDATLGLIQNQLTTGLLGGAASGSINSITQLGITAGLDGKLTLDKTALESVLNSHFADVTGFLQNSSSFGMKFASALNGLGNASPTGAVYLAQQQNTAEETALNKSLTDEDARIAADKTRLTAELNSANQILQSIPSQLNQVNELYNAFTGYNQSSTG
jgi:flagellar hook-associated protein 2